MLRGKHLSPADITKGVQTVDNLLALIKDGNAKNAAIKKMLELSVE